MPGAGCEGEESSQLAIGDFAAQPASLYRLAPQGPYTGSLCRPYVRPCPLLKCGDPPGYHQTTAGFVNSDLGTRGARTPIAVPGVFFV